MNQDEPQPTELTWAIETSRDGENWRFFGKAWTCPGEPLLLHGLPRFVRYRLLDRDQDWSPGLERTGDEPMALIDLDAGTRCEIWPGPEHEGLPVLLPPSEEGRLLRFDHSADATTWRWALEFRGRRHKG